MSDENIVVIDKLRCKFPKLTETNQQYILGLVEGLEKAQNNGSKKRLKRAKKKR